MASVGLRPHEVVLEDVEIINNHAGNYGGGLWLMPTRLPTRDFIPFVSMRRCTVQGNTAEIGGGAAVADLEQFILEV
eukprot:149280-Rhodomonas_salina.1